MSLPSPSNSTLVRKAFTMSVNPGRFEEYQRRHNPICPELERTLKEYGVRSYSIFYHNTTRQLFAFAEVEDDARWEAIAQTDVCQRWWKYMSDIMPTNTNGSPASASLTEVFRLS